MKRLSKTIIYILLIVTVLSLFLVLCSCEQGEWAHIDGAEYLIFKKKREAQFVMLENIGATEPVTVTVPAYITYQGETYPVTKVSAQLGYLLAAGPPRSIVDEGYIKELIIPETVKNVDFDLYDDLDYFERITVSSSNNYLKDIDGVLYDKIGSHLLVYPPAKQDKFYVIPETVQILNLYVFIGCHNLESVYVYGNISKISGEGLQYIYCGRQSASDEWELDLDSGKFHFGVTLEEYLSMVNANGN